MSTEGVGRIGVLRDVNYTPKFGTNLLSVAELCDLGYTVIFEKHGWRIVDSVTFNLKGEGIRVGNLFWIDPKELKPPDIACSVVDCVVSGGVSADVHRSCVASTKPANNIVTWHQRLHIADDSLLKLSKFGLVDGLKLNKSDVYPSLSMCNACALSKMTRRQFRDGNVNARPEQFFIHIVSDVEGPVNPGGIHGEVYIISFIEVRSNFKWIYMMKTKDQSADKLLLF